MSQPFSCPQCGSPSFVAKLACNEELEAECCSCGHHHFDHPEAFDDEWYEMWESRLQIDDPEYFEWRQQWKRVLRRVSLECEQEMPRQHLSGERELRRQRLARHCVG